MRKTIISMLMLASYFGVASAQLVVDATAAVAMAERSAVTTYIRNQVLDSDIDYSDYNVELENVTIEPDVFIEIGKDNEAVLRSSVKVMKGGSLTIYNGALW